MEEKKLSKKDFYIYRFNLLQSYFSGSINNGKNFFNNVDAYAYAWSQEIYPIFDCCFADDEFKDDFRIKESYVQMVVNELDQLLIDYQSKKINNYPDYYTLQSQLGGKSKNLYLSEVLRYIYLSNKCADPNLWKAILSNVPSGSGNITKQFNKQNDVIIFLA